MTSQDNGGRPYFSNEYTTSANVAAGATSNQLFVTLREQEEFAPFDTMLIVNLDNVAIAVNMNKNPANRIIAKANETVVLDKNASFSDFDITNLDAANDHTAGKIKILVQKFEKPKWL